MRVSEIELSAAKNNPLPNYMTAAEMCLYISLRALYSSWHKQEISKESAQTEKRRIIAECERYETEYVAWVAASAYYQQNIRKAGTLLSEIEKADDVRIMLDYAAEAIGCMTGDENFHKRIKKKVEEIYT